MISTINLGWGLVGGNTVPEAADTAEYHYLLFRALDHISAAVRNSKYPVRYKLNSPWFISEIEDLLRVNLLLAEKILVEVPHFRSDPDVPPFDFLSGAWHFCELGTELSYTFPTLSALQALNEHFGDTISGNEVLLVPSVHATLQEPDDDDPSTWRMSTASDGSISEYQHFFRPINEYYAISRSGKVAEAEFAADVDCRHIAPGELSLPVFTSGDIKDLVSLRRDESDSFFRWREYYEDAISCSNVTQDEIQEAVAQGFSEHHERVKHLKRQGLLGDLSAGLTVIGLGVSVAQGDVLQASTALGLGGLATALLSERLSKIDRRRLSSDPFHLLWLTNRLHNWRR